MAAPRQAASHRVEWLRRATKDTRTRLGELLLWYWALSLPGSRQLVRPAYLQPLAGALLLLVGVPTSCWDTFRPQLDTFSQGAVLSS